MRGFFFYRIVDKINNSIGQDPDATNIIGVLDIYGFESFKINRFALSSLVLSGPANMAMHFLVLLYLFLVPKKLIQDLNSAHLTVSSNYAST
jgi:hypothetical protein